VALPEGVDEDLALRVGVERQKRRLFPLLNDRLDVEQELPVLLRQILDALFPLGAGELGLGKGGGCDEERREKKQKKWSGGLQPADRRPKGRRSTVELTDSTP